jgi:hypothetical protein
LYAADVAMIETGLKKLGAQSSRTQRTSAVTLKVDIAE